MVVLKLFGIILAMIFASAAAVVAQLYSPPLLWAVAFALIVVTPGIAFVNKGRFRIFLCAALSLFINANFILHIPYGNPVLPMIMYSVLLTVFTFSMIYAIMHLSRSLKENRR
jgi:hypothetical protein